MNLMNNPAVKAELDAIELQIGSKALCDMPDYAVLFNIKEINAPRHMRRQGIPHIKVGRKLYVNTLDLALFLARKKALRDGRLVPVAAHTQQEMANRRGFTRMAHDKQLAGDGYAVRELR